jgi:hypothetical protein
MIHRCINNHATPERIDVSHSKCKDEFEKGMTENLNPHLAAMTSATNSEGGNLKRLPQQSTIDRCAHLQG